MALIHSPFGESGSEHAPFLPGGGGGGGITLAEVLEILHGLKEPKTILKAALSEEINELLGKGGPPSGPAGGVLAGTYPNPSLAAEAVTTAAVKLLAITAALLGEESVTKAKIAAFAVDSGQLSTNSVTTAKIAPEAVTTAIVKLLAITTALLGEESVTEPKLAAAVRAQLAKEPEWKALEAVNAKIVGAAAPFAEGGGAAALDSLNFIHLRGTYTVKAAEEIAVKSILFTLPAGARPEKQKSVILSATTAATTISLIIKTNGEVELLNPVMKPAHTLDLSPVILPLKG
jgi:hypothetical protein